MTEELPIDIPEHLTEEWEERWAVYHRNHADTIPFIAPGERDAQRIASNRAYAAMMLARTPEAWFALLRGEPVPLDQLDQLNHARAKRRMGHP